MKGICAAGELLIDFTPCGTSPTGQQLYARNPGGAPANVLAMAARFGVPTRLCAVVGDDNFGVFLKESVAAAGVDGRFIRQTRAARTTLAFVDLDANNDRTFTFYRKPGADILLKDDRIPTEALTGCGVFHFSGVSLTEEPARGAVLRAAERAKRAGLLVSFDPNFRPFLWLDAEQAKKEFARAMYLSDLIKVSEEEARLMQEAEKSAACGAALAREFGALVLVSRGEKGALLADHSGLLASADALSVDVRDTTGAGDAFLGSILALIAREGWSGLQALTTTQAERLLRVGCAAGSLAATKLGAIPALPTAEEVFQAAGLSGAQPVPGTKKAGIQAEGA